MGKSEEEAHVLAETVDHDRAAYIKHYFEPELGIPAKTVNFRIADDSPAESSSTQVVGASVLR